MSGFVFNKLIIKAIHKLIMYQVMIAVFHIMKLTHMNTIGKRNRKII